LSVVFRMNGGNAGPRRGHGVKQRADEMNSMNVRALRMRGDIL
jgi:hypothetical protein